MKSFGKILLALGLLTGTAASAASFPTAWKITHLEWTPAYEDAYSDFVAAIGNAQCDHFSECIRSPANPYRSTDDPAFVWTSDCADLPYNLRAYFAWKNGLPFGYVSQTKTNGGEDPDPRYGSGNIIVARKALITPTPENGEAPQFLNAPKAIRALVEDDIWTGTYRFFPKPAHESPTLFDDFYSPAINRTAIRPGTAVYDPDGHILVVRKVEDNGRILLFDAHTGGDSGVEHNHEYGPLYVRDDPAVGAGFRNWRPIKLVNAKPHKVLADGSVDYYTGGTIVGVSNAALAARGLFSTVQYFGNTNASTSNWKAGKFSWNGEVVPYYDYVRYAMSKGAMKFHPVEEVKNLIDGLCGSLKDRVAAVDGALSAGIQNRDHPASLPANIYGTVGDWEAYATPSRDARIKTAFKELRDRTQEFITRFHNHEASVSYDGSEDDLKKDLLKAYQERAAACSLQYLKSDGTKMTLGYDELAKRAFTMSFDPYDCAERRWGATESAELASCHDNANKEHWYTVEQRLRNQIDRRYDLKMNKTADDLVESGLGVANAPGINTLGYLMNNQPH